MLEAMKSGPILNALFVLALIGLSIAIHADNFQTIAKYYGAVEKRIAHGYNLAMKVMLANRFGAVLYFVLIAFNTDNGLTSEKLAIGLTITVFALAIPTIGLLIWLGKEARKKECYEQLFDISSWSKQTLAATFFSAILNTLGLTIPWIAATAYPDLRLTLANSSFLFNTIFSIINVFFIEQRFAQLIDKESPHIHGFIASVIVARLMAYIIVGIGLWTAT